MWQGNTNIALIDDDEAVRDAYCELFRSKGFSVQAFESAEAFLVSGLDKHCGVVVVDLNLPQMSGIELLGALKAKGDDVPVIVITGQGDVPKAVAALKAGAIDFIEKPCNIPVLLGAVTDALSREPRGVPGGDSDPEFLGRLALLTERERQVMELVVAGHPNKVIAVKLGISIRTAESHRAKVMEKTQCGNLSALIREVLLLGPNAR